MSNVHAIPPMEWLGGQAALYCILNPLSNIEYGILTKNFDQEFRAHP